MQAKEPTDCVSALDQVLLTDQALTKANAELTAAQQRVKHATDARDAAHVHAAHILESEAGVVVHQGLAFKRISIRQVGYEPARLAATQPPPPINQQHPQTTTHA